MSFERAERVADAMLYEGYMLYPYRASALKNKFRWQFGVVAPRGYSEAEGSERWFTRTECLAELGPRASLTIKLRFLQIEARTIEIPSDRSGDTWCPADAATVGDDQLTTWDEAVERAFVLSLPAAPGVREFPVEASGGRNVDIRRGADGRAAARVVRERVPISGRLLVGVEACGDIWKIAIRVENTTMWNGARDRVGAIRQSLVGAHTLLAIEDGAFLSLQDPPAGAEALARSCVNLGNWPVLAGSQGARDVILSSPIILSDYPAIAPESAGNLFDATEIDELLTLRVMTLTDGEKREARATDERTRRLIDRADSASAEALARLHGAVRNAEPATNQHAWEALLNPPSDAAPEHATLDIPGASVASGSKVRLKPQRRADSIDMFLTGRLATVIAVYRTLENEPYVAVTIDDDPGADLRRATGRFFYFAADEIVAPEPEADGR